MTEPTGRVLYVSPSGNDTNPRTDPHTPLLTIQRDDPQTSFRQLRTYALVLKFRKDRHILFDIKESLPVDLPKIVVLL